MRTTRPGFDTQRWKPAQQSSLGRAFYDTLVSANSQMPDKPKDGESKYINIPHVVQHKSVTGDSSYTYDHIGALKKYFTKYKIIRSFPINRKSHFPFVRKGADDGASVLLHCDLPDLRALRNTRALLGAAHVLP